MLDTKNPGMLEEHESQTELIDSFMLDGEGDVTVHRGDKGPEGEVHNVTFVGQPGRFFTIYKKEGGFATFYGDALGGDLRDAVRKASEMQGWKKEV